MASDDILQLLVVTGPTASGKTAKAVSLAKHLDGEIVSADSRQIYRNMDIGTGKDLDEYGDIPNHMIDICPAGYKYNLYEYLRDANKAITSVRDSGRLPILCGGTGLYIESILKGIELPEVPENRSLRDSLSGKSLDELTRMLSQMKTLHNTTDVDTCQRAIRAIEIAEYYNTHPDKALKTTPHPIKNALIIGIDIDRESRRDRISSRLDTRLKSGMVEEVDALLKSGISAEDLIYYGLEYKYLTLYLTGQLSYQEMYSGLETAIHQFAKRQMTWFRGMERRGFTIHWLPYDMPADEFNAAVKSMIEIFPYSSDTNGIS